MRRRALVAAAPLLLSGCGSFLASGGPRMEGVLLAATSRSGDPGPRAQPLLPYPVVTLDPRLVDGIAAAEADRTAFAAANTAAPAAEIRLGIGDVLAFTVFESQPGGLFLPADAGSRPGNFVQLPPQQVGRDGMVTIPFGGQVPAAGRSVPELSQAIVARLRQRALDPQVVVTLIDRRSAAVAVVGEVTTSLRFTLDPGGERVLGAIARAAGPKFPPYETLVTLQRGGRADSALMSEIAADPRLNIQLRPDDTVIVSRQQRYFLALGALGQTVSITQLNRRFAFEDARLTLADAMARAGGLQDDRANPAAVFLFRLERRALLDRLGVPIPAASAGGEVPTVYHADFLNPSAFFLAQRFPMRHGDLIFVSNAPATDLQKFLQLLLPITSSAAQVRAMVGGY